MYVGTLRREYLTIRKRTPPARCLQLPASVHAHARSCFIHISAERDPQLRWGAAAHRGETPTPPAGGFPSIARPDIQASSKTWCGLAIGGRSRNPDVGGDLESLIGGCCAATEGVRAASVGTRPTLSIMRWIRDRVGRRASCHVTEADERLVRRGIAGGHATLGVDS